MPRVNDTVMLSGWLFADLLLALAVLFLVANTSGIKLAPVLPPTLIVTPTILDANANMPNCTGGTAAPQCTLSVKEAPGSQGNIVWTVSSDMSDSIKYSNQTGMLSPDQAVTMTISAIPCQNGSFTFKAQREDDKTAAVPVIVSWHCIPPQVKPQQLDLNYKSFSLTIGDVNAFLSDTSQDDDIRRQIQNVPLLQGKMVGLAIVYGGAPDTSGVSITTAQQIASKIYGILRNMNQSSFPVFRRSAFYVPLYTLGTPQSQVNIDVFFFT